MNQSTEFILQKYLKTPRSLLKILLSVSLFNGKYSFDKITDFPNPDFYLQYRKPNHLNLFKNILFFFNQIDYSKFKLIEHSFHFVKLLNLCSNYLKNTKLLQIQFFIKMVLNLYHLVVIKILLIFLIKSFRILKKLNRSLFIFITGFFFKEN